MVDDIGTLEIVMGEVERLRLARYVHDGVGGAVDAVEVIDVGARFSYWWGDLRSIRF